MSSELEPRLADYLEQFYTDPDVTSDSWVDSVSAVYLVPHIEEARRRVERRMESIGIEPHGLLLDNE